MNCTATTRLTAEECLARLDALRPMPRGERMAEYAADHQEPAQWAPGRCPLWHDMFDHHAPRSVLEDPNYGWPHAEDLRAWAAPVRRLREERRALRARVRELEAESAGLWADLQRADRGEP